MINTLTGTIIQEDCGEGFVSLEVGDGIAYQVFVVSRTIIDNSSRKFFIHENIVAAQQGPSKNDLYGFETKEERGLFRAIIKNCDRVGPSAAMKAMNIAPPKELLQAIRMGNEQYLARGVGTKTAQSIILGMAKYVALER